MIILLNTYLAFSYDVSLLLLLYKNRFIFLLVSLPSKCFMLLKTEDCLSNVLFATCLGPSIIFSRPVCACILH